MKIVVFSNLYPPVFIGGYEIGASHIVNELRRRGHEVLLLTAHEYFMYRPGMPYQHGAHTAADEAGLLDTGLCVFGSLSGYARGDKVGFLRRAWRTFRARGRYRRAIEAFRPDALLAFNPLGVVAPVLGDFVAYSKRSGAPACAYVSDHWVAAWPSGNPLWPLLCRFLQHGRRPVRLAARVLTKVLRQAGWVPDALPLLDVYFYCSAFVRKISRDNSHGIADHRVVHWGLLDTHRLPVVPAERFRERGPLTALYAGQLLEHKGLLVLVRALARCQQPHRLVVIGDDQTDYAARCKHIAGRLGVLERIQFVGKKDNAQTRELLGREGHVLVVPSVWDEPFSIVVLEGMGVGLPVIATHTGGTGEAIEEGRTGFLFPRGDHRELARVLDRLDADRGLCQRVGAAARRLVLERFTMEQMVDQILDGLTGTHAAARRAAA